MQTIDPNKLLLPLEVTVEGMKLSPFQGTRIASTAHEAIEYGFGLMELRARAPYEDAAPEVRTSWEKHTDEFIARSQPSTYPSLAPEQAALLEQIANTLQLQRNRERGSLHLSLDTMVTVWVEVKKDVTKYLESQT
jgi:hypothetical protein